MIGLPAANTPTLRYTHAPPSVVPPGRSALYLSPKVSSCILHAPTLGTGNPPAGVPRPPAFREPCRSVHSPPGSAGRPGKDALLSHRALSAVRRGGWPVPASALCWAVPAVSLEGALGVSHCAHSLWLRRAPPHIRLSPGSRAGAVTTPFWLVISSPSRPACQAEPHTSVLESKRAVSTF